MINSCMQHSFCHRGFGHVFIDKTVEQCMLQASWAEPTPQRGWPVALLGLGGLPHASPRLLADVANVTGRCDLSPLGTGLFRSTAFAAQCSLALSCFSLY